jgi:hypothetical protein
MVARPKASALVMTLAREVRSAGISERPLIFAVRDIFMDRAEAVNNEGLEAQIATIIETDGVERGSALIRAIIQNGAA